MSFNNAGVFNRLYNWVTDAANGINIQADRMDAEMNGFADGLSLCLTRDSRAAMIADLKMGGFKIVNVKDPVDDQDAATKKFVEALFNNYFGVVRGCILMWSGAVNAVPQGWVLCDGQNGTPDLRNRFIVGAGDAYAVNDTGGANSVTLTENQLPAHKHTIDANTGEAGAHSHVVQQASLTGSMWNISETWAGSGGANGILSKGANSIGTGTPQNTDNSSAGSMNINATHTHTVDSAPGHTHSLSGNSGNTGGGASHENRPPYLALAYIMKT